MPEALAIVAVVVIAAAIYVFAWAQSRNPAYYNPHREQARLEQHVKWLEERLAVARDEEWGQEMMGSLEADLAVSTEQLTEMKLQLAATEERAA